MTEYNLLISTGESVLYMNPCDMKPLLFILSDQIKVNMFCHKLGWILQKRGGVAQK